MSSRLIGTLTLIALAIVMHLAVPLVGPTVEAVMAR